MEPEYPSTYFTDDAKDFLKKLMIKNPEKRLGINGIAEIKNHAWLSQIDFGLLEAGYLDPPFAPNQDEVNADSLRHLGRSQQDDKYKKVRLTPDFKKQLENFHFQSEIAIQKEIVEVLQKEDAEKNFEKFSKSTVENDSVLSEPPQGMTACCTLM
jgi:serine/threonine protein kinase